MGHAMGGPQDVLRRASSRLPLRSRRCPRTPVRRGWSTSKRSRVPAPGPWWRCCWPVLYDVSDGRVLAVQGHPARGEEIAGKRRCRDAPSTIFLNRLGGITSAWMLMPFSTILGLWKTCSSWAITRLVPADAVGLDDPQTQRFAMPRSFPPTGFPPGRGRARTDPPRSARSTDSRRPGIERLFPHHRSESCAWPRFGCQRLEVIF